MTDLIQAHRQWATRPPDQRFETIADLLAATERRRDFSVEDSVDLGALKVRSTESGDIELHGLGTSLGFTNWSFGQFCGRLGAPPKYLADLPASLVAENLNAGLETQAHDRAMVYSHRKATPEVAAFTSKRYGRLHDAEVVRWVRNLIRGSSWRQPLANPVGTFGRPGPLARPSGLFASDRDLFMFLVDEDRRIEFGEESLARGFFVWNSEVGSKTFGLMTFLYRFVCGNLIVWGAEEVSKIRIRHVGDRVEERAFAALHDALKAYRDRGTLADKAVIQNAMAFQVAKDDAGAEAWLTDQGFSRQIAHEAVHHAVLEEGGAGTLWQLVNGLTAHARSIPYQDQKSQLEGQAGKLLDLVA